MNTQRTPIKNFRGNLAEVVMVRFQAAKVVLGDDGYRTVPGTDVFDVIEVPAYRMAGRLERYVAQEYPGLALVDWEVR